MPARARAEWNGDLKGGHGTFTAGDSITGDYSFRSRFEDGPGANPEQLIGAAHAACFSMALSNMLDLAGNTPDSIKTDAVVTIRQIDGAATIASIALTTVGVVPGINEADFLKTADAAKTGCIVSRALTGIPEITLDATLKS